jgi:hypothetical protein
LFNVRVWGGEVSRHCTFFWSEGNFF